MHRPLCNLTSAKIQIMSTGPLLNFFILSIETDSADFHVEAFKSSTGSNFKVHFIYVFIWGLLNHAKTYAGTRDIRATWHNRIFPWTTPGSSGRNAYHNHISRSFLSPGNATMIMFIRKYIIWCDLFKLSAESISNDFRLKPFTNGIVPWGSKYSQAINLYNPMDQDIEVGLCYL